MFRGSREMHKPLRKGKVKNLQMDAQTHSQQLPEEAQVSGGSL